MLNLIILILFLHILFYDKSSSILACGIFAFMSDSAETFSWDKFNIVGVFNDDRGGDSCGRATEDFVEHGIGTNSDYKDLVIGYGSPQMKYKTVLGHARKASVGQVKKEFAQPVVFTGETKFIKKKKGRDKILKEFFSGNNNSKDKTVFAGVHNGTIVNYIALATKYSIDAVNKNDSGILLEIIYRRGLDVLIDYIGTAALIWYDFTTDTGYAFHGKSATYAANKGKADLASEEKPLFMYKENESTMYLSSIEDSLKFIGGTDKNIESLDYNTLYIIKNGQIIDKVLYDRAVLSSQKEPWPEHKTTTYDSKEYKTYDDWYYNKYTNTENKNIIATWSHGFKLNPELLDNNKIHIWWEKRDAFIPTDTVFFWKGRYWLSSPTFNGIPELINGAHYLDSFGSKHTQIHTKSRVYYFIDGVMMVDRKAYEGALLVISRTFSIADLARELSRFSCYPVHAFDKEILKGSVLSYGSSKPTYQDFFKPVHEKADCDVTESKTSMFFTGTFKPLFSKRTYIINRGDLLGISDDGVPRFPSTEPIEMPEKINNPVNTVNSPDCPCDFCRLDYKFCEHCQDFDEYNETLIKMGGTPAVKNDSYNDDSDSSANSTQSYDDIAYQDLVIEETHNLVEEGIDQVQDLIDSMGTLGGGTTFYNKVVASLEDIKDKYESLQSLVENEKL